LEEVGFVMPVIDEKAYRQLVTAALPHVIHTEEVNQQYIAELQALHNRERLTPEEEQLGELLTLLLEDFEARHYRMRATERLYPLHFYESQRVYRCYREALLNLECHRNQPKPTEWIPVSDQ
jgi:hypothetical protein